MILRSDIKKASIDAKKWFIKEKNKGKKSIIYKTAKSHVRNENFIISFDDAFKRIDNIEFYYEDIIQNWGETDGVTLWLNTSKNWNYKLLKNIIIHEALHFIIRNQGRHFITEKKEHNIMEAINPNLIYF